MQVGDRARLAEAARAALDPAGGEAARSRAAHRHRAGKRRCRHAAVRAPSIGRWPTSRARGWPARSPSPTGRCTTSPTPPPGGAPLNVLIPAKGEETDRRLRVIEAPSYGIVGKTVTLRVAIEDLGVPHPVALRQPDDPPRRRAAARRERADRRASSASRCRSPAPAPPWWNCRPTPLPGEVSTINNRAVVEINGVRDRLRVLLISGEPHPGERTWRRLLKADPVGRSGALHHPAPAGEGRPDAAERAGADRLPGARAVPRQDQRVRPDHPGPVPESRPAADALHRQHRRARARRRRAAAERRAGVLRREQPGRDADRPGAARRAGVARAPWSRARSGPASPISGQRHPVTEGLAGANPPGNPDAAAGVGVVVSAHPAGRCARRGAAGHARQPAAAAAGPRRQGPRRAAAVRSDLAVVARPSGRRAAGRTAAPGGALADAGAGAGGERADRACRRRAAVDRAPLDRSGAARPGDGDRSGRQDRRRWT